MAPSDIDRGEVTIVDPNSIDLTGRIKPYWDDAVRYFAEWEAEHPTPSGIAETVLAWADCERRARRKWRRSQRVAVKCPTCHGTGIVLRAL